MPQAYGLTDGTHMPMKRPNKLNSKDFLLV